MVCYFLNCQVERLFLHCFRCLLILQSTNMYGHHMLNSSEDWMIEGAVAHHGSNRDQCSLDLLVHFMATGLNT